MIETQVVIFLDDLRSIILNKADNRDDQKRKNKQFTGAKMVHNLFCQIANATIHSFGKKNSIIFTKIFVFNLHFTQFFIWPY